MVKRRNSINDQWSARRREMLESPANRVLSQSAHRAISRIELELCYHGGNDNGQLPITFENFIDYGIDRASVAPALREGRRSASFAFSPVDAVEIASTERRTNSTLLSRTAVTAARSHLPTSGAKSRLLRRLRPLRAPHVPRRISAPSLMAKSMQKSELKNKSPVRENLTFPYCEPIENENGPVRQLRTTGSRENQAAPRRRAQQNCTISAKAAGDAPPHLRAAPKPGF